MICPVTKECIFVKQCNHKNSAQHCSYFNNLTLEKLKKLNDEIKRLIDDVKKDLKKSLIL